MKKIIKTIAMMSALFYSTLGKGQITLDTVVHPWNLIGYDFYPVQISDSETKYYFQDTLTNTFSLYNMDFSPFLMNVSVPEPFNPFVYNYLAIYISRSLFDCDSSNIEYAYTAVGSGMSGANKSFYIMRTDGTQLFKLDSAVAPYCFGCLNGSQDIRPIIRTSSGTKLFLYYPSNTNNLNIFSLCGSLPTTSSIFDNNVFQSIIVSISPNPTEGLISFQVNTPDNLEQYELMIYDVRGIEQNRQTVSSGSKNCKIDMTQKTNGTYYYKLVSKNQTRKSGKFILIK